MNQALSFQGADVAHARPARPGEGRSRRRETPRTLARVPILDWPVHLFNDNAPMTDLAMEDYAARCDRSAVSLGREFYARAAA
jgi:hypothetical protein